MQEQMQSRGAVLVYFRNITWRLYLPTEVELKGQLPLVLRDQAKDGAIYKIK